MRDFPEFLVLVGMFFVFMLAGYAVGRLDGKAMACESVGLEWVKDKCMKVTREPV